MNISEETERLYVDAIKQWGVIPQMDMATEECAELIKAINKLKRSFHPSEVMVMHMRNQMNNRDIHMPEFKNSQDSCVYHELCGEIADVRIMIEQLSIIFSKETIQLTYERKLERLKARVNKSKGDV